MSEKPKKRRFWQLHLSTAVLLMLGAGGIGWPNSVARIEKFPGGGGESKYYGWPMNFVCQIRWDYDNSTETLFRYRLNDTYCEWAEAVKFPLTFLIIIADLLSWTTILLSVAVPFEYLIRRREGRKP